MQCGWSDKGFQLIHDALKYFQDQANNRYRGSKQKVGQMVGGKEGNSF